MINPCFKEIKNFDIETSDLENKSNLEASEIEKLDVKIRIEKNTILPRNGGEWTGESGNSNWKPDPEAVPGDRNGTNPEHKTWGEIMEEYNF